MAWYDDPLTVILIVVVAVVACGAVVAAMRRYSTNRKPQGAVPKPQKNKPPPQPQIDLEYTGMQLPFKVSKSIQGTMANSAKDELRMLDLEREILGDAIRRLYEAQAEGKITESERDKLAASYKQRMNTIKDSIQKDESIIALHELEGMQEDLMKLFSERFGELTSKVEELRSRIDVKPIREIPVKPIIQPQHIQDAEEPETETDGDQSTPTTGINDDKPKRKRKTPEEKPDQKTEAERRIESIRSEVEKVLDKLGQMEIES